MSIKDILLHLDPSADNAAETEAALDIAQAHDAHLAALITASNPDLPLYGFAGMSAGVINALEQQLGSEIARVRQDHEAACDRRGMGSDVRVAQAYEAEVSEAIALHGRHADLLVMRQSEPSRRRAGGAEVIADVVLAAGRPVLTIPYTGAPERIGRKVLVGWDGSREAARALSDAMPLIRNAEKVDVLVINPEKRRGQHGEVPGADISLHLARHGLTVELDQEHNNTVDPANLILSRAADIGSDLLVMGAFAHSRIQQAFFGGVTRTILEEMTLPVLLSH